MTPFDLRLRLAEANASGNHCFATWCSVGGSQRVQVVGLRREGGRCVADYILWEGMELSIFASNLR